VESDDALAEPKDVCRECVEEFEGLCGCEAGDFNEGDK
jgi:hypothetical protein